MQTRNKDDRSTTGAANQETSCADTPIPEAIVSPYFLSKLLEIRRGDSVSGSHWQLAPLLTRQQATVLGHVDRITEGLDTVLTLLQASETCRRRRPEDFGIGEDRHEGLVYAARELTHALRAQVDTLEARHLRTQ